jgi:hypothetical protein
MTTADKTLEQMVAEMLEAHRWTIPPDVGCCSCGWICYGVTTREQCAEQHRKHQAAELAPLFAWREVEAKLQEAFFFDEEILDTYSLAHPDTVGDHIRGLRSAADAARAKKGVRGG